LKSAGGSNLWLDNKKIIDNDGAHGPRSKVGKMKLVKGQHHLRVEYFHKTGIHGVQLSWKAQDGPGWMRSWKTIGRKNLRYQMGTGFKEEVFYVAAKKDRIPDLCGTLHNNKIARKGVTCNMYGSIAAANQRIVKMVNYPDTKATWKNFQRAANFAVRWSGYLETAKGGPYRFSLSSDDGSRMFLMADDGYGKYIKQSKSTRKLSVNNDGLHAWRQQESTENLRSGTVSFLIVEFFQKVGSAGISFRYMGADTNSKMVFVGGLGAKLAGETGAVHVRYLPLHPYSYLGQPGGEIPITKLKSLLGKGKGTVKTQN